MQQCETMDILVEKIPNEENLVNALTKSIPQSKFKHCLDLIGLYEEYKFCGKKQTVI